MKYPDARIIVFCKAPEPGRVNTRLIPHLGERGAARLHEELAARILTVCTECRLSPVDVWCDPDSSHPFFSRVEGRASLHAQSGGDLGDRMALAFSTTLAVAGVQSALLVGTDCPGIDAAYLDAALGKLQTRQAVIGPAEDGGYGLIGLRRSEPDLFSGIVWGSSRVCEQTCRRLNEKAMDWALLPLLWDVDRPQDVARYRREFGTDQSTSVTR